MIKRTLAAVFGAVLFAIIVPVAYWFIFSTIPFGNLNGIFLLVGIGVAVGATLGAIFPKTFGFIFEAFLDH